MTLQKESASVWATPRGGSIDWHPNEPPDHAVQFYEDESFLTTVVAEFLDHGLKGGAPIVVIATAAHRRAFTRKLEASSARLPADAVVRADPVKLRQILLNLLNAMKFTERGGDIRDLVRGMGGDL